MTERIWRSSYPSFEPRPALVDQEVLQAASRQGDRTAVVEAASGRSITFNRLANEAQRLAAWLRERGIGRSDVVSIVAENSVDFPVVLYGALAAGAAVMSANPALTAPELARRFGSARPGIVFADVEAGGKATEALAGAGVAAPVQPLGGIDDLHAATPAWASGRDAADLALLYASSGTTGLPKIVAHTHATMTAMMQALSPATPMHVGPDDIVCVPVPFAHIYGTGMLTQSLAGGATVVTLAAPDAEAFLRLLQDHRGTVALVTPPLVLALARHPLADRLDLSSLRRVITGAAPCPVGWQDEVERRLGCRVVDSLGSTEGLLYAPPGVPHLRGSCGVVGPNVEAVVVDPESGTRLGPDQPGELWVRGPQVMAGYLGDDEATAAALDTEGWLRTGDLCTIDDGGNVFVVDRLKDLIKVGGYSVAPAEVEAALLAHPAVADAGVVGRPDPDSGEVPVAYVALVRPVDGQELMRWLEGRLAPWKRVRDVVPIEAVPRNPAGKILRLELKEAQRAALQP